MQGPLCAVIGSLHRPVSAATTSLTPEQEGSESSSWSESGKHHDPTSTHKASALGHGECSACAASQLIAVGHSMLWYSGEATEKGSRGIKASCFLLCLGLSGDINSNKISFDWQCFPYSKPVKITYIWLQGIFFGVNCGFQKPEETNTFPPPTS